MAETKTKQKAQQQTIAGEAPTGNLPAKAEANFKTFMQGLTARQKAYEPLLPAHVPFEKFQSSVRAALTNNPDLLNCIPQTFFRACAEAAELGLSLSPSLKEADILKVYNSRAGGYEAQFRPRFQGLMKLARQSGEVSEIDAHEVYKWDHFDYAYGLKPFLEHRPGNKPQGYEKMECWGVTHVYATWKIAGITKFEVMDLEDVLRIMRRSSSKNKAGEIVGPWVNDFPEMARKTAVRRASKYMPLSAERMAKFAAAVNLDDRREGGEDVTIDHDTGEIVDITGDFEGDAPPAEQQQRGPQRQQQMDDLESRMAGSNQGQQAKATPDQRQRQAEAGPRREANATNQPAAQQQQPPAKVEKLEPPMLNGMRDLEAWIPLAEAAVQPLNAEQRAEWKALHAKILDAIEYSPHVDALENLSKMLP